jgi:hypothetical protein
MPPESRVLADPPVRSELFVPVNRPELQIGYSPTPIARRFEDGPSYKSQDLFSRCRQGRLTYNS